MLKKRSADVSFYVKVLCLLHISEKMSHLILHTNKMREEIQHQLKRPSPLLTTNDCSTKSRKLYV